MATIEDLIAERKKREQPSGLTVADFLAERDRRLKLADAPVVPEESSFLEKLVGGAEGALSLATGIIAEPAAGIFGAAAALDPFASEGAAERGVARVKNALTFKPRTREGRGAIGNLGEVLRPIVEPLKKFQKFLGDDAFAATGSETLAALMATIPAAALELLPIKKLIPTRGPSVIKFQETPTTSNKDLAVKEIEKSADKALQSSAPSVEQLKNAAGDIYNQIDALDIKVKPQVFRVFAKKTFQKLKKEGFDVELDPLVTKALKRLVNTENALPTSEIGILRKAVQRSVESSVPAEARIGRLLKNDLDDMLINLNPNQVVGGDAKGIGSLYKTAGELWKRSVKTEKIADLFDNADLRHAKDDVGFKNAIQSEFLSIVKKNKKTKQFNPEEIAEMRKVIEQGKGGDLLSFIGRLDLTQQQKANMLVGVSTFGAGVAVGGPLGFAVPGLGFVSRKLADRLVKGQSEFAQSIVAAGQDGQRIAREYLKRVPTKQRDSLELTELLINNNAALGAIKSKNPLVLQAVENAKIYTPTELAIAFGLVPPKVPTEEEQQ